MSKRIVLLSSFFLLSAIVVTSVAARARERSSLSFAETNTYVGTKLKDIYYEKFNLILNYPAYVYEQYGEEEFWVSTAYVDEHLYVIRYYNETYYDAYESFLYSSSGLKPCGNYTILIVVIDCQNTNVADLLNTLPSSIENVNKIYEDYSNSLGLARPFLEYQPFIAYISTSQNATYFDQLSYDQLLSYIGDMTGYDPTDYDMWCLAVFDATYAPAGCYAQAARRFVRMNMFWLPDSETYDEIDPDQISPMLNFTLFRHEVYHLYGWEHYWGLIRDPTQLRVAPELFGWIDIDGDGVIEILDNDPYYGVIIDRVACPWLIIIILGIGYVIIIIIIHFRYIRRRLHG